ncbi:MAG: lipo-like protein [Rhodospirillales bacterium]|nr:lipo-like protein [Rhodospirillales bacterium]
MNRLRRTIGRWIADFLTQEVEMPPALPVDIAALQRLLHRADVILVEGNLRISAIIKYLTQSTWSHAVLYAGDGMCIEADVVQGVRRFPLAELAPYHIRVCRPISITPADADKIIAHAESRIGVQYDLRHVFDLARYMVPLPMPQSWRRRAISLGSADPSRAICSTLIAEAFQIAGYPILPEPPPVLPAERAASARVREIFHIRDTGLFAPRDFDISPYFHVIKPDMPRPFDHHNLVWLP